MDVLQEIKSVHHNGESSMKKVVTIHCYPPIPERRYDWLAHYEGEEHGDLGWGRTEIEAIIDLQDNAEEAA
jgi:hypothetical protein